MTRDYGAKHIEVLEGLEAVRRRPGMYIGSTGTKGLHHLIWEVVDNAVDEHLAGHGEKLELTIHKDNSITIRDYGRGIPVDVHPDTGKTAVETVLTTLHAGGKFGGNGGYKVAGGLHGVGVAVVNALSTSLCVRIWRDGHVYEQTYRSGVPRSKLIKGRGSKETGTSITFLPDETIFDELKWDTAVIFRRLKEYAFLNKGFEIVAKDEREESDGIEHTFLYHNGLLDFVEDLTEGRDSIHENAFYIDETVDGVRVQLAMKYIDSSREVVLSFANNIKTIDGGYHETGFRAALTRGLNSYGRDSGLLKAGQSLAGEDAREGLVCVLSVYLENPQFEGQTKNRLGNSPIRGIVESLVSERLQVWLENNPSDASLIVKRGLLALQAREAARKAREAVRSSTRRAGSGGLPGKLTDCRSKNVEERELFLVEGDSAGGTAKQARNRETQAILPLRGKILNVERVRGDRVFDSEEIKNIVQALGCGVGEDYDPNKLRYGKVIILVDADVDGSHIATLLQTFFYRYLREMISEGRVFFGQPPLFSVVKGGKKLYFRTEQDLDAWMAKNGSRAVVVQRFKGLGEMQPEQLAETAMDPTQRVLLQLTVDDETKAERMTDSLMGRSVVARRELIQSHNFDSNLLDI